MPVFDDVPVLCGHRGAGRGPGENTLEGFRAAVASGLRWVEVDVRLSADGELVCCHDPVFERRRVARVSAAESGLLRLEQLLEELPPQIGLDIDVKTALQDAVRPRDATTAARVARLATRRERVLVTSFDPSVLPIVRERAPEVPLGLLTWRRFPLRRAIPAAVHLGAAVVAPCAAVLRGDAAAAVADAHAAGLQVLAWDVARDDVERLSAAGVDCLVVD